MVQNDPSIVGKKFLSNCVSHLPVWPFPPWRITTIRLLVIRKKYVIFPPTNPMTIIAYYTLDTDLLVFTYRIMEISTNEYMMILNTILL